jgi:hypothetical protein
VVGRDGRSFATTLAGEGAEGSRARGEAVFLEWVGDDRIPAWRAVRTPDFTLIRYADGFEELYDPGGRLGPADRWESINRAQDPRAAGILFRLRAILGRVLGPG